jgi:hypothetical protein
MDERKENSPLITRRDFIGGIVAAGVVAGIGTGIASTPAQAAGEANKKLSTVPLNWKEVYYTNCPLISASNIDQELGWTREEYKKIGVKYAFLRSTREND